MSTLELIIVISIAVVAVFSLFATVFIKRKKSSKDDKKSESEKKVEPVYKKEEEQSKESEDIAPKTEKQPEEKEPFKIIRKKSKVKINKKALTSGSRNPSVAKVFGKDAPKEEKENTEEQELVESEVQINEEPKPIERFGVKEYEYSETNTAENFKINAPKGSPSRSFELNKREFGSHLNVSEDGNLSGVVGIGIKKSIESATNQIKEIEKNNDNMIRRAHGALNINSINHDDMDYFERRIREMNYDINEKTTKKDPKDFLKDIDAKTLIVAEAISNPKYKNATNRNNSSYDGSEQ